ncbi:hypothetical protein TNCT_427601 [Trichonephila clavata]|uniref:Uncharacterized protein n=1 Tax=Trichonephila clavata TaxID=2740835 RepID=A0A8X6LZD2_TRICU|nr:hypothetical protein TNCT_427601 [Trichonephila clavata]
MTLGVWFSNFKPGGIEKDNLSVESRSINSWFNPQNTSIVFILQDNKATEKTKDFRNITETEGMKNKSDNITEKTKTRKNIVDYYRYKLVRRNRGYAESIGNLDYTTRMILLGVSLLMLVGFLVYGIYVAFKKKPEKADDTVKLSEISC